MKRMTVMLTAATLALVPLASNAAKKERNATNPYEQQQPVAYACSCAVTPNHPYTEIVGEEEVERDDGVLYDCTVSWPDVIGAGTDNPDKASYGASFEVEVPEGGGEDAQVLNSEIDPEEWSDICKLQVSDDGTEASICTVNPGDAPFILTDFTGESLEVEVRARVKAFETGQTGKVPRNFEKSIPVEACLLDFAVSDG